MKTFSNSIQPNYPCEGYEDEYQSAEAQELEDEINFHKREIIIDIENVEYMPVDELCSFIKYSMAIGDEEVYTLLEEIFINAVGSNFQPETPLNKLLAASIQAQAERLARKSIVRY
jgi:hypothetical protein